MRTVYRLTLLGGDPQLTLPHRTFPRPDTFPTMTFTQLDIYAAE